MCFNILEKILFVICLRSKPEIVLIIDSCAKLYELIIKGVGHRPQAFIDEDNCLLVLFLNVNNITLKYSHSQEEINPAIGRYSCCKSSHALVINCSHKLKQINVPSVLGNV